MNARMKNLGCNCSVSTKNYKTTKSKCKFLDIKPKLKTLRVQKPIKSSFSNHRTNFLKFYKSTLSSNKSIMRFKRNWLSINSTRKKIKREFKMNKTKNKSP